MSSLFRHKRSLLAVTAVVLLATGAAVVATGGTGQSRADASTDQPVTQRFGVFRQDALSVAPSSLSDKAQLWLDSIQANQRTRAAIEAQRARLASEAAQAAGANTSTPTRDRAVEGSSLSSLARVDGGDGTVVVAALGDEEICAYSEATEVGTCATAALAEAGRAFSAAPAAECGSYHVIGIMPDGVSSLQAKAAGTDAVREIPVTSNVYEATLGAEETVLTSQNPPVEVVLPLGDYARMNPGC